VLIRISDGFEASTKSSAVPAITRCLEKKVKNFSKYFPEQNGTYRTLIAKYSNIGFWGSIHKTLFEGLNGPAVKIDYESGMLEINNLREYPQAEGKWKIISIKDAYEEDCAFRWFFIDARRGSDDYLHLMIGY